MSAKEPATRAAGMPAPMLMAPPVWVAEAAGATAWVDEDEATRGVEVAATLTMLELGVGVAVTELTRTRVLVMVVVAMEVVSSAAANWAAARQRTEVKRALSCIFAESSLIKWSKNTMRSRARDGIGYLRLWTVHRSPTMTLVRAYRAYR